MKQYVKKRHTSTFRVPFEMKGSVGCLRFDHCDTLLIDFKFVSNEFEYLLLDPFKGFLYMLKCL